MRLFLVFFMLLLLSCSHNGEIIAQEIQEDDLENQNNKIQEKESSCDKVRCSNNFICKNGKCICKGQICGNYCVINNGCCVNADCDSNEQCIKYKCVEETTCQYKEIFDEKEKKCICEENYFYCEAQNKCLKKGSCCDQGDCGRYEICSQTYWAVNICFQYPSKKKCKMLRDVGISETMQTPEGDFLIKINNIFTGDNVKINIDDKEYELKLNERIPAAKGTVWIEEIKELGGSCKVYYD